MSHTKPASWKFNFPQHPRSFKSNTSPKVTVWWEITLTYTRANLESPLACFWNVEDTWNTWRILPHMSRKNIKTPQKKLTLVRFRNVLIIAICHIQPIMWFCILSDKTTFGFLTKQLGDKILGLKNALHILTSCCKITIKPLKPGFQDENWHNCLDWTFCSLFLFKLTNQSSRFHPFCMTPFEYQKQVAGSTPML